MLKGDFLESSELTETFPVLREMAYLNHAGVAPLSGPAAEAIRRYADQAARTANVGAHWYRRANEVKKFAARMVNARGPQEIAFVPNTTTGLAQVANGLTWRRGDNVVITNVEYPANRYPWENLTRRGVDLIEVEQGADGRIDPDAVADAVTDRTRVVSISHVQYSTGHRIDLQPISETVHRVGGYLCVDAIQSVGVLPVDVEAMGIDFLAADGHKWMLGPEGAGIFYCDEELAPLLQPAVAGWLSMVDAWRFGNYRFELQPDARRFEPGTYNIPGILALGASLELLLEVGVDKVWERVEGLTSRLCDGLTEKGYRLITPRRRREERSGIVTFEPLAEGAEAGQIVQDLESQGIIIVVREGRLRASPHFYNTPEQIDRLLDALP